MWKRKRQVADSQKAIEAAQNELKDLYAENEALVSSLQSQQADAQAQIAENETEDAALQEQLQQLIEERNRQEQERKEQAAQQAAEKPDWKLPLPAVPVWSLLPPACRADSPPSGPFQVLAWDLSPDILGTCTPMALTTDWTLPRFTAHLLWPLRQAR
mgnify:CR=1 FL=1